MASEFDAGPGDRFALGRGSGPRNGPGGGPDGGPGDDRSALPSLSVVVVTYNEAARVETCLESVLAACEAAAEVILVDSNSTDRTVELARDYPVRILRIPDDDLTTPGAGRYVGQQAASGDQILFVDGDMRLSASWLERARRVVRDRDGVAGVDGHLNEPPRDGAEAHTRGDATAGDRSDAATSSGSKSVGALRGVALYDAAVLERVDGFDPYLRSLEDVELGYRITDGGYELRRLPGVAASHPYTPGAAELLRRWRNGYYFGLGQAVRKNLDSARTVRKLLARHLLAGLFACWVALGAASALAGPSLAVAWLGVSVVLFAADVAWEGTGYAVQRVGKYVLTAAGFVRGFLLRPRDRAGFPVESTVLVQKPDPVEAEAERRPVQRPDGGTVGDD